MAYASASNVEPFCRQILSIAQGASAFSAITDPSLTDVNTWLSSGCSIIETKFQAKGYSIPIGSDATIYDALRQINAYYAVAMVELTHTNVIIGPGERTRGQLFMSRFETDLDSLLSSDLTQAGVTKSDTAPLYAGGISVSDKDSKEDDTDRVKPRFVRNQFGFPGTAKPDKYSEIYDSDS